MVTVNAPGDPTLNVVLLALLMPGAWLTVNVTALLVPPAVVTVTFCAPVGAFAAIVNVAVTELAVDETPLAVTPVGVLIVAPVRFVPLSVTGFTT